MVKLFLFIALIFFINLSVINQVVNFNYTNNAIFQKKSHHKISDPKIIYSNKNVLQTKNNTFKNKSFLMILKKSDLIIMILQAICLGGMLGSFLVCLLHRCKKEKLHVLTN